MAKYQVTFSCGHTEEIQLFGKTSERERKIKYWERNGLCTECYRKQQAESAAKKTQEFGLPELEGTEKQIAWALKIRNQMILALQDTINGIGATTVGRCLASFFTQKINEIGLERLKSEINEKIQNPEARGKILKDLETYLKKTEQLDTFKTTTSAKWIIDNRI